MTNLPSSHHCSDRDSRSVSYVPCDPFLFSVCLFPSDADSQEEQEAHLRAHLQGGRSRGKEGLLRPQALRDRVRAQPPGHQGHAGEGERRGVGGGV